MRRHAKSSVGCRWVGVAWLAMGLSCGDDGNGNGNGGNGPSANFVGEAAQTCEGNESSWPQACDPTLPQPEQPLTNSRRFVLFGTRGSDGGPDRNCEDAVEIFDELLEPLDTPFNPEVGPFRAALTSTVVAARGGYLFDANAPGRLAQYCYVEVPENEDVDVPLFSELMIPEVSEDTVAVIPQAWPGSYDWEEARNAFRIAAGRLSRFPIPAARVSVALIDSFAEATEADWTDGQPLKTSSGDLGRNHGLALGRIMEELLCTSGRQGPGRCLASVRSFLGIRATQNDIVSVVQPDGYSPVGGSQGDLARAIYRATQILNTCPDEKLVINLSVGWAPRGAFGGQNKTPEANELPAAAAVFDALRYARCRGAAVVAAAGNNLGRPGRSIDELPVYPGGWAQHIMEDSICTNDIDDTPMGFAIPPSQASGGLGPVLLSVGALNLEKEPLPIQRRRSATAAAIGELGISRLSDCPAAGPCADPTPVLNGSSVATAVASSAVAALWSVDPNLSANQVINQTLMTSDPASSNTNAFSTSGNTLKNIRVCDVIRRKCTSDQLCGNEQCSCEKSSITPFNIGSPVATMRSESSGTTAQSCFGVSADIRVENSGSVSCLSLTSVDDRPTLNEQPGCDPCVICFGQYDPSTPTIDIILQTDTSFQAEWLEILREDGTTSIVDIASMIAVNPPSAPVLIESINVLNPLTPFDTARIIWSAPNGDTTSSSLPLYGQ